MNIKELREQFKDALPDRVLARDLELYVRVNRFEKPCDIILEDDTGTLEAVTGSEAIMQFLQKSLETKKLIKLRGRLDKTEFENLGFSIEEILEQ